MSESSHISDDIFRIGVLGMCVSDNVSNLRLLIFPVGTMIGGLGLWSYSQFFKKRSYLVEWRAAVLNNGGSSDDLEATAATAGPVEWVTGTSTFTERQAMDHTDVFNRVFAMVQKHEKFQGVPPENLIVEIPHVHVL
jgi:hypothetical protein